MAVSLDDMDEFIRLLAAVETTYLSVNFYTSDTSQALEKANETRRHNLRLYFGEMAKYDPDVLLIGEAPGYRGCLLTGIPFTSEFLLLEGINCSRYKPGSFWNAPWRLFGQYRGYQTIAPREVPKKEATATMVWNFLQHLPTPPLLWNAYPFHPHRKEHLDTNRPPSLNELELGIPFLAFLTRVFEIKNVIAIGNKAQQALRMAGMKGMKVRHPSHGGKSAFTQELADQLDIARF